METIKWIINYKYTYLISNDVFRSSSAYDVVSWLYIHDAYMYYLMYDYKRHVANVIKPSIISTSKH